jgi:peroxin-12
MDSSAAAALNPSSPGSVGALLIEEWTINPYATLPSLVENVMMSEASRSTHHFVGTAISAAEHALRQRVLMDPPFSHETIGNGDGPSPRLLRLHHIRKLFRALLELRRRVLASTLSVVRQYKLELQYLVTFLIERCCLGVADAMVGETLYGAMRVKLGRVHSADGTANEKGESSPVKRSLAPLSRSDKTRLALLISFVSYLREKNDVLVRKQQFAPSPAHVPSMRLQTHFLPLLHTSLAFVDLFCRWRYLMGRSIHFDLFSLALQQVVRRVTQQDTMPPSDLSSPSSTPLTSVDHDQRRSMDREHSVDESRSGLTKGSQLLRQSIMYMMVGTLAVSWLTQIRHEYLTYRRNQATLAHMSQQRRTHIENQQNTTTELSGENSVVRHEPPPEDRPATSFWLSESSRVPPPPPTSSLPNEDSIPIGGCPLCRRSVRRKPTASVSGYVFCFTCILNYVKQHHKCPVTRAHCEDSDLVRLYEPEPTPTH